MYSLLLIYTILLGFHGMGLLCSDALCLCPQAPTVSVSSTSVSVTFFLTWMHRTKHSALHTYCSSHCTTIQLSMKPSPVKWQPPGAQLNSIFVGRRMSTYARFSKRGCPDWATPMFCRHATGKGDDAPRVAALSTLPRTATILATVIWPAS